LLSLYLRIDSYTLIEKINSLKHFYFLLLISFSIGAFGQTVIIIDEETDDAVSFASLSTTDGSRFTTANGKGEADFSVFKKGDWIEIRSLGYKTAVLEYDEIEAAAYVVLLETDNFSLDEVVLSANKWQQRRNDVPAKTMTITTRDVALQNPQTAADLLGISGGVYIQKSQQGGGSPMIRGYAANRLLYSVDGVRMNSAIFRSGNLQNVINLDPFAMENTEVIFGPGSVIYGSDAVGGVMSFQTLKPKFAIDDNLHISGKGVARYASANHEKTGHFDINVGFEKWSFLTSISHWDFDHLRQGSHGPEEYIKDYYIQRQGDTDVVVSQDDKLLQIPTAYAQSNVMQKIRFRPESHWDVDYGFHYSETSDFGRYDRHLRQRNGTARYGRWDYGPQIWMMNNLGAEYSGATSIFDQMQLRFAHQYFEESRLNRNFNSSALHIQKEKVNAYSFNADYTKTISKRNTLFYGVEYVYDDVVSEGSIQDVNTKSLERGPSRYPKSSWQSIAAYVTDRFKVHDRLTLSAGIRYNHIVLDSEFDTTFYPLPFTNANLSHGALTGSVGGVYRPDHTWVLTTNFGTAFRAPNVDDVGKIFDSAPGLVVVPNPDLKPEYAYNIDLGVAKIFEDVVKLEVTGYYSHLNNSMMRHDYTLNGRDSIMYQGEMSRVQALQNSAVANIYGMQVGMEIKLPQGFRFDTSVNFQRGEEEFAPGETSPIRHAVPFFGVSKLKYANKGLQMELNVRYNGERSFDNMPIGELKKVELYAKDEHGNPYAPAWYTLNFKSLYRLDKRFDLSVGVENLTDQRYRTFGSGVSGAGRNFIMGVTAHL